MKQKSCKTLTFSIGKMKFCLIVQSASLQAFIHVVCDELQTVCANARRFLLLWASP